MARIKCYIAIISLIIICSCTNIKTLKLIEPRGDYFKQSLFYLYKNYAEKRQNDGNWLNAHYFALKAINSAYDREVLPEIPSDWLIKPEYLIYMNVARLDLMLYLENKQLVKKLPQTAAFAQFYFDCWVESQEWHWHDNISKECKNKFYYNITQLRMANLGNIPTSYKAAIKKDKVTNSKKIISNKVKPKKLIKKALTKQKKSSFIPKMLYKVTFQGDSIKITTKISKIAHDIAKSYKIKKANKIIINSYVKSSDSEDHNLKISKKRANIIKEQLIKYGIKSQDITIFAYGNPKMQVNSNKIDKDKRGIKVLIF